MKKFVILGLVVAAGAAHAQHVAYWTFDQFTTNSNSSGVGRLDSTAATFLAANVSSSLTSSATFNTVINSATTNGQVGTFTGTVLSDPRAVPAATGAIVMRGTNSGSGSPIVNGQTINFLLTATGGKKINLTRVAFDYRHSSTGFLTSTLSMKVNGGGATSVATGWNSTASTFTAVSSTIAVLNATTVEFIYTFTGGTGASGASRLDNVQMIGTVVPEPASFVAVGIGAALMLRRRSKK